MSLIRPRYCLTFALALIFNLLLQVEAANFAEVVAAAPKGKWNINDWTDTKEAYSAAVTANPILEVLYAWAGVDDPEHWHPDALHDITPRIKSALSGGKILITKNAMKDQPLTGKSDFSPGKHKAWGIIYRDTDGVHFRRGNTHTGVALPAIASHYGEKNARGWGGYFTSHQFEETDRGLVTYSCKTKNDNNIHLSDMRHAGRWHNFDHYHHTDHLELQFVCGGWSGTKSLLNRRNTVFFDYDHNFQGDINGNGNLIPDIYSGAGALRYDDWKDRDVNFWFAYDHGWFRFGEGTPTNEETLSGQEVEYLSEVPASPPQLWLRYFALRGPGTYTNIKSRFLNPAKKFRTPVYLKGKFPFWREVWKTETPGSFSLKFKGRGKKIFVALNDVNPIATDSGTSDLDQNKLLYRIEAQEGRTIIHGKGAELCDTTKTYSGDKQKVHQRKGTGGGSSSAYYDYWITIDGNVLSFGHGTVLGENIVCQYNDVGTSDNGRKATYFSFSSDDDESDYIDITHAAYSTPYILEPTNGQFTGWNERWALPEDSRGGITFKARNLSGANKTVAIGFNKDLPSATAGATYSVSWGDLSNSASLIKKLGTPVDQKQHTVPTGAEEWGEYWVKYSAGSISYGTGNELDRGILGSWTDAAASEGMKYFGFGSGDNSIEVAGVKTHFITAHNQYDANPPGQGVYKQWQSSWSLTNNNQGALSFDVYAQEGSLDVTAKVGFTTAGNDSPGGAVYDLLIGKKEVATHKVVLSKLGVEKASATISEHFIPNNSGHKYWVIWYDERVFVGFGHDVGNLQNVLLSYDTSTDASATAPTNIRRFSFTSNTGIVSYRNISSHPFSMIKSKIDAQEQTAETEAGTIAQWHTTPANQTIPASYARRLYWHPQHSFTKDEPNTSLTFTVKKPVFAEKAMPLIALGTAPAPTTPDGSKTLMANEDYAGASYVIGLKPEGSLLLLKKNGTNLNALTTSPINDKIKALNDGQAHAVWFNYEGGVFKLGIDTSLGVEPVWEYTDTTPLNDVRFIALGTGGNKPADDYIEGNAVPAGQAAKIELSSIEVRDHYDPTRYLTPSAESALHYQWRSDWKLPYPNNGSITFTLKPHGNSTSGVMGAIGFGPDTLPANQPSKYHGAMYNILFSANSRVQVTKAGYDNSSLDGRISSVPEVKTALTDGQAHNWWLMFADRTMMLGIDTAPGTEPVWSWSDPIKQNAETVEALKKSVQHFSFSSSSGQLLFSNISVPQQEAAKSLSNEILNFEDILITNPNSLIARLDQLMTEQVHKQNITAFIGTLSMIGRARELIPEASREPLAKIIQFTMDEPGLNESQKGFLRDAKALLTTDSTLEELTNQYLNDLSSLSILTLEQTDPVRKLFMHKLKRLSDSTKVTAAEIHLALDPFNRDNTDKLGTLLNAISPELITDEPEKINEDVRFLAEEKEILLALAQRIQKERETLWSATSAYRLEKIKEMTGIGSRLLNIRTLIDAKRNDSEGKIEFTDADYATLLNLLRTTVENRWQLPQRSFLFLERTLKAAQFMPGINDVPGRKEVVQELIADAKTVMDFNARLESAQELLTMYETATSANPGRVDFFTEALPRVFDGEIIVEKGKTLNSYFQPFITNIIMPLRAGPISEDEEKQLVNVIQIMERRRSEFNQFTARMIRAAEKSETLFDYAEALLNILNDKDEIITFGERDYETFVGALYDIIMSRELLSSGHIPKVQILIDKALFTPGFERSKKYMVAPDKSVAITLGELKELLIAPYDFASRIKYAIKVAGKIITKPVVRAEETEDGLKGEVISDPLVRRLIAKLRKLKDAPNESNSRETEELFTSLDNDIFMSLLSSNRLSKDDLAQLQQIRTIITAEKDTLIASQKTFRYNFQLAQKDKGSLDKYVKEFSRIMRGIQQKTMTFEDDDVEVIRAEVNRLLDARDELNGTFDIKQIISNMKFSALKGRIPELEKVDENKNGVEDRNELNTYEQLLLPENAFEHGDLVKRYAAEATDIPSLPINDGIEDEDDDQEQLRTRFFAKLRKLLKAPNITAQGLSDHLAMLDELSEMPLDDTELSIVNEEKINVAKVAKQHNTVRYRLSAADTNNETFFGYAQDLDRIMKDKGKTITFDQVDYEAFSNAIGYLVGNREVLDGEQRSFVRSMLDSILNQFEDIQGDPIKEEMAPGLFLSGFGPYAKDLFGKRERLATAHTMKHRVLYAKAELNDFERNGTHPEHPRFRRFMQKMAVITDAPGVKERAEFSNLKSVYESLNDILTDNQLDTSKVTEWLEKLPKREEEVMSQQQSFSYQIKQANDQKVSGGLGPYIAELKAIALRKQNSEVTFKPGDYILFYEALEHLVKTRDALSRTEWFILRGATAIASTKSFSPDEQLRTDFIALNESVKSLPDFNVKVKEYLDELEDIKGAGTKSELRATFYKKLSNVSRLPGFKEVARINDLVHIAEELLPFAATPTEKQTLNTLTMVILKEKMIASTLSYHLAKLQKEVTDTRQAGGDYFGKLIENFTAILTQRSNGDIVFTDGDHGSLVHLCKTLLNTREVLSGDQRKDVQDICAELQTINGFEEFDMQLEAIKKEMGDPQTLETRLQKYERQVGAISGLPMKEATNIAAKAEFVSMVKTIMDAPGDRTESILDRLTDLVDRIKRSNFTDEQKESLAKVASAITEEKKHINSFAYRAERIGQSPTPIEYHNSLETLIDGVALKEISMTAGDRRTFINILKDEVKKRPLIADTGHPLLVVLDKTKTTIGFDNEETVAELSKIGEELLTNSSLVDRITDMSRLLPLLLRKEKDDGARRRFFIELENFTNNLGMLSGERLTLDKKETIANARSVIARYKNSSQVTASEKELINSAVTQLVAISKKIDAEEAKRVVAAEKAEAERLTAEQAAAETARREADIKRQAADKAIRRQEAISGAQVKTKLAGLQRTRVNRRRRRAPVRIN